MQEKDHPGLWFGVILLQTAANAIKMIRTAMTHAAGKQAGNLVTKMYDIVENFVPVTAPQCIVNFAFYKDMELIDLLPGFAGHLFPCGSNIFTGRFH